MKLIKTVAELREEVALIKSKNETIGLVPTMGALHEGHGSLIAAANKENDCVIVIAFFFYPVCCLLIAPLVDIQFIH